mgnify:CR=1 FL=1
MFEHSNSLKYYEVDTSRGKITPAGPVTPGK